MPRGNWLALNAVLDYGSQRIASNKADGQRVHGLGLIILESNKAKRCEAEGVVRRTRKPE